MSKFDDYIMLETALHLNHLKFDLSEDSKQNLFITQDGSIIAYKNDYVSDINKTELTLSVLGYKDINNVPKKIDSEDSFKKILFCLSE